MNCLVSLCSCFLPLLLLCTPRHTHFRHFTHPRQIHLNLPVQFIVIRCSIIDVCEHPSHLLIQSRKHTLRLLKLLLSAFKFLQRNTFVLQYLPHLSKSLVFGAMKNSTFNSTNFLGCLPTQRTFTFSGNNGLNNQILVQIVLLMINCIEKQFNITPLGFLMIWTWIARKHCFLFSSHRMQICYLQRNQ